tara:strand:- start:3892 stop:4764 length:873 start_codon:yes stop_codon:yes gene_type:complete
MSEKLQYYIDLTRIKKPIGYMLLFWPCSWGLTISYDFNASIDLYFFYLFLFFAGSLLMRSAGCIINDVVDKNYDSKVKRTRNRPIAAKKVSVKEGLLLSMILCLIALIVLLQFNNFTIILALASMPLAFTYPYFKRFTYWPQLYLGITFNYGILLGWTSIRGEIELIPLIFYFGAIFWTLGYDTIYGYQDIKDDEIIGLKSTSIKFKNSPKIFLILCYLITISSFYLIGYMMNYSIYFYIFLLLPFYHLIFYQIKTLDIKKENICLKIFKSNNFFGLLILISVFIGNLTS